MIIIIDDFHRLPNDMKQSISDKMKVMADAGLENDKLVLVGINKAGDSLVHFSPDLNNRIDTMHFEANGDEKIAELIEKGEKALNVKIGCKNEIVENAYGSFHIAQMLCHKACIAGGIERSYDKLTNVDIEYKKVIEFIMKELERIYFNIAKDFATGTKLRKEGRAPYLHLFWLAKSNEWSLNISVAMAQHPSQKASIGQVVDKGFLASHLMNNDKFGDYIHYDPTTKTLTIEDPKFVFFLRNINWQKFSRDIGFLSFNIDESTELSYDIALSFAGNDRLDAQLIADKLAEHEISVFYDKYSQVDLLAENIEEYLRSIYKSGAKYIVPLISKHYSTRIWTKLEAEWYDHKFELNRVIPIWYSDTDVSLFDKTRKYGGIDFDIIGEKNSEIEKIVDLLCKKIEGNR